MGADPYWREMLAEADGADGGAVVEAMTTSSTPPPRWAEEASLSALVERGAGVGRERGAEAVSAPEIAPRASVLDAAVGVIRRLRANGRHVAEEVEFRVLDEADARDVRAAREDAELRERRGVLDDIVGAELAATLRGRTG